MNFSSRLVCINLLMSDGEGVRMEGCAHALPDWAQLSSPGTHMEMPGTGRSRARQSVIGF